MPTDRQHDEPDRTSDPTPAATPDRSTDQPTDAQAPSARRRPDSGEAVPAAVRRRLEHPPSDRFAVPSPEPDVHGSLPRTVAGAALPGLAGAVLLMVLASPLAVSEPLVLVALLTGIAAGRGARWGGARAVSPQRRRAIATAAVLLGIAAAQIVIWQLAIAEGGVLPLGEYLVAVFGPVAPLELIAGGAAAWATA
jgi:hypothetical protein